MVTWENTQDDSEFIVLAMAQIANEIEGFAVADKELQFSDFQGVPYDESTSAQSAILQRAASLKEYRKEFGYVRMA